MNNYEYYYTRWRLSFFDKFTFKNRNQFSSRYKIITRRVRPNAWRCIWSEMLLKYNNKLFPYKIYGFGQLHNILSFFMNGITFHFDTERIVLT